jgi:Transposase
MAVLPDSLSDAQQTLLSKLTAACPEMTSLAALVSSSAGLLTPPPANEAALKDWAEAARACDLPNMHAFTRGLDLDIDAAIAAVTLPFHNGRTEGVNTKTKMIKRQMYGRRVRSPAPPHPARLTPRSVTTESATEPFG